MVFLFLALDLGVILGPTRLRCCLAGVSLVLFVPVVLDGTVAAGASCIKVGFRAGVFVVGLFLLGSSA